MNSRLPKPDKNIPKFLVEYDELKKYLATHQSNDGTELFKECEKIVDEIYEKTIGIETPSALTQKVMDATAKIKRFLGFADIPTDIPTEQYDKVVTKMFNFLRQYDKLEEYLKTHESNDGTKLFTEYEPLAGALTKIAPGQKISDELIEKAVKATTKIKKYFTSVGKSTQYLANSPDTTEVSSYRERFFNNYMCDDD